MKWMNGVWRFESKYWKLWALLETKYRGFHAWAYDSGDLIAELAATDLDGGKLSAELRGYWRTCSRIGELFSNIAAFLCLSLRAFHHGFFNLLENQNKGFVGKEA